MRRVGGLSYARWKIPHTFETRGECSSPSGEVLLVVRWLYFMEFRITFMLRASCFVFVLDSCPIRGGTMKIGSDLAPPKEVRWVQVCSRQAYVVRGYVSLRMSPQSRLLERKKRE